MNLKQVKQPTQSRSVEQRITLPKVSLQCILNKMIKEPGTSSQFPALSQKHVRNICHITC